MCRTSPRGLSSARRRGSDDDGGASRAGRCAALAAGRGGRRARATAPTGGGAGGLGLAGGPALRWGARTAQQPVRASLAAARRRADRGQPALDCRRPGASRTGRPTGAGRAGGGRGPLRGAVAALPPAIGRDALCRPRPAAAGAPAGGHRAAARGSARCGRPQPPRRGRFDCRRALGPHPVPPRAPAGAYHYDNPVVAPSLAALGRLATAGPGTLVVRRVPLRPPTPVPWPLAARPAAAPGGPGSDNGARPAAVEQRAIDPVRDDQIESNLLWLLSHVDKDRDRAAQSPEPAPRVLQVLGSFTNAMFAFATHLAPTSRQRVVVPRQADVIAMLRPRHPLLAELELRKDEIDAPALARRYKALARDAAYAADFYRGMVRGLLALTQHAATLVLGEIGDPAVRARCAAALEVWVASVEGALQEAPSAER